MCLFVACVRGQGNDVTAHAGEGNSTMSVYLPLQSQSRQLYNLLTATHKNLSEKLLKGSSRPDKDNLRHACETKKKEKERKGGRKGETQPKIERIEHSLWAPAARSSQLQSTRCTGKEHVKLREVISVQLRLR